MRPADLFARGLVEDLLARGRVRLAGFGTFWIGTRAKRQVTNPATHQLMQLGEATEIRFRAAKSLKQAVQRGNRELPGV